MECLRINEMSDYTISSCSSSEYEEMVESDIDLDDMWNTHGEMMSAIEHGIEVKNKTELTDSQDILISKVPETTYSKTKPKVNKDVDIASNSSFQNHRKTTLTMNSHFVNGSTSEEDNNTTGDEFHLSLLQLVNITSKKDTVFELPGSSFDRNAFSITSRRISTFLDDHNLKSVDLSAIKNHTFLPLDVFGVCGSKSCKTSVRYNPYIQIPRCDENMKLFNSSNAEKTSRGIHLANYEDDSVVCPFGDSDSDGSLMISSDPNSNRLSKQGITASVDLDFMTANENADFQLAGFQPAERKRFSNPDRLKNKSLMSKRSPSRGLKPRLNPLKESELKKSAIDSYVDIVDLTQQGDSDSDLEVDIVAEWDSVPFITKMLENIKNDHNYILANNGASPLDKNKQHKTPPDRILKKTKFSNRNVTLKRKKDSIDKKLDSKHNLLERKRRLDLRHLFEHLHRTVVENPFPLEPKIGIIRKALNEIRSLEEREQVLLGEKRQLAFQTTSFRKYIRRIK